MKITFEFNSDYKGKGLNNLKAKLSSFLLNIFGSICSFFVAIYWFLYHTKHVMAKIDTIIIFTFTFLGVALLISSPFVLLFKRINKGIKGLMKFIIEEDEQTHEFHYTLYTILDNLDYKEEGLIDIIDQKSTYFMLKTKNNTSYLIPSSELSLNIRFELASICAEIKNRRIKKSSK